MTERPDRRRVLECLAWGGTGVLWTVGGGVAASISLDQALAAPRRAAHDRVKPFTFVQVSDSHIGFNKPPNPDARATYREAVAKIQALPQKPDFIIHTGDVSQLSKDQEFDDADQILSEAGVTTFHVPGEHDMLDEGQGKAFLARYGKDAKGDGWYSFDHSGVHFVGLITVKDLKAGGSGHLGDDQLAWLKSDLAARSSSQPIVVFTHIPLWAVYPDWGWGVDDSEQAMILLRRFGSVTVLNGHIHQVLRKVEGNVSFHTARSTAFPQPAPGGAPSPGPLKVAAEQLRPSLGIRTVNITNGRGPLAVVDTPLG
jgi:3',5'-cyclic AMP phosphodiesterase CpdA